MVQRVILALSAMAAMAGCATEPGPDDPKLSEAERRRDLEEMYTPEEAQRLTPPKG
jgi:hypothetical protein